MPEVKLDDSVLVRLKVIEVRETAKGKKYKVKLPSDAWETMIISPKDIVE